MKAVLISIQPKWVELIASGKKTVEVRKTRPKLETPFKCYIYETRAKEESFISRTVDGERTKVIIRPAGRGKVIGEFVCDSINVIKDYTVGIGREEHYLLCGGALEGTCLSGKEMYLYGNGKTLYGWHISDLKIYDKPKELVEFRYPPFKKCKLKFDKKRCENGCVNNSSDCSYRKVLHPPQSWCYVEE